MRRLISSALLAGILSVGATGVARAQASLRLYSDPTFTQCTFSDTTPGVLTVYVAFTVLDADWVHFRVAASPGFTGVWQADTSPWPYVGSSQSDLYVVLNTCPSGKFLVATITYQMFGTSTCSELSIAPPPGYPDPDYDSCGFTIDPVRNTGSLHVNCSGLFDCNPVATEPTTWGRVKALYR